MVEQRTQRKKLRLKLLKDKATAATRWSQVRTLSAAPPTTIPRYQHVGSVTDYNRLRQYLVLAELHGLSVGLA